MWYRKGNMYEDKSELFTCIQVFLSGLQGHVHF